MALDIKLLILIVAGYLEDQIARLDELIVPLVAACAPGLLGLHGVGPGHRRAAAAREACHRLPAVR